KARCRDRLQSESRESCSSYTPRGVANTGQSCSTRPGESLVDSPHCRSPYKPCNDLSECIHASLRLPSLGTPHGDAARLLHLLTDVCDALSLKPCGLCNHRVTLLIVLKQHRSSLMRPRT